MYSVRLLKSRLRDNLWLIAREAETKASKNARTIGNGAVAKVDEESRMGLPHYVISAQLLFHAKIHKN